MRAYEVGHGIAYELYQSNAQGIADTSIAVLSAGALTRDVHVRSNGQRWTAGGRDGGPAVVSESDLRPTAVGAAVHPTPQRQCSPGPCSVSLRHQRLVHSNRPCQF